MTILVILKTTQQNICSFLIKRNPKHLVQVFFFLNIHSFVQRPTFLESSHNRGYLKTMLKIVFFACQGLALRGHDESEDSENKGNFKEIVSLLASKIALSHAKYFSKEIQNNLLKAAVTVVLQDICKDIRTASYFALTADKCRDLRRTQPI